MKKKCLLLIVVLLCLSGCDTYRYRNTYRVEFTLGEFLYLLGDHQALPKTPEKTEMVLRFPLSFA